MKIYYKFIYISCIKKFNIVIFMCNFNIIKILLFVLHPMYLTVLLVRLFFYLNFKALPFKKKVKKKDFKKS